MNQENTASVIHSFVQFLQERLGEDKYDVSLSSVEKLTGNYDSIQILKLNTNFGVNLPQSAIAGFIEEGSSFEEIADGILDFMEKHKTSVNPEIFTDYESVKDRLFIRLSNTERNKDLLAGVPHNDYEGLSATVHIYIESGEGFASIMITDSHLEALGVSWQELFEQAVENSGRILPASIHPLAELVCPDVPEMRSGGLVVTNDKMLNGAAVILYPGILEQAAEVFDEDFYIFPSSIHETILFPLSDMPSEETAYNILYSANRNAVEPEDWLSDTLYVYRRSEGTFHPVPAAAAM